MTLPTNLIFAPGSADEIESALMFKNNRIFLLLFILYCGDSVWKLGHWQAYTSGLAPWLVVGALTVRFTVMAWLLSLCLQANRKPSKKSDTDSGSL
jgi:hypothetical protein